MKKWHNTSSDMFEYNGFGILHALAKASHIEQYPSGSGGGVDVSQPKSIEMSQDEGEDKDNENVPCGGSIKKIYSPAAIRIAENEIKLLDAVVSKLKLYYGGNGTSTWDNTSVLQPEIDQAYSNIMSNYDEAHSMTNQTEKELYFCLLRAICQFGKDFTGFALRNNPFYCDNLRNFEIEEIKLFYYSRKAYYTSLLAKYSTFQKTRMKNMMNYIEIFLDDEHRYDDKSRSSDHFKNNVELS